MNKLSMHFPFTRFLGIFVIAACVLSGCATTSGATLTYKISKAAGADQLRGKKAVVFAIAMSERQLPNSLNTNFGGGLPGGAMVLARINGWKKQANAFKEELEEIQRQQLPLTYTAFTDTYKQNYSAETVSAQYDFGSKLPSLTFFNKPNAKIKGQIAKACQDNSADYAITIIEKITHGQINNVGGHAITQIRAEICIFDKAGTIVAQSSAFLPIAGYDYGFTTQPDVADQYVTLFRDMKDNLVSVVPHLGAAQ
jgi:hypothetical protein